MSETNYKSKYEALKAKFMESVDMAFRLGYEQGTQEAQMDSVMQQQQQQADQMASQANGMSEDPNKDPSAEVHEEDPSNPQGNPPDSAHPGGSELDQHISQLEGMLGKGEMDMVSLIKAVKGMKSIQQSMKTEAALKKSAMAIPAIARALHKPKFKLGVQATHNMGNSAKKAVNMQAEIVDNIMKSWEEESHRASKDILSQLKVEGLVKDGE